MWAVETSGLAAVDMKSGAVTHSPAVPLAHLADDAVAKRFCAWLGISGRRYIGSVFAADIAAVDCGLPFFDGCILMAIASGDGHRRILFIRSIDKASERFAAIDRGKSVGVDEWHVHFLADTPQARAVATADLARRHLAIGPANCA